VSLVASSRGLAYDFMGETSPKKTYPVKPKFKVIKPAKKSATKFKNKKRSKLSLVLTTLSIFGMLLIVSYRSNIISEKNLQVQRLKISLDSTNANYASTEIALSQKSDINYIEAYAKQQLGMQKPEKNQIVYINKDQKTEISKENSNGTLQVIFEKVRSIVGKII